MSRLERIASKITTRENEIKSILCGRTVVLPHERRQVEALNREIDILARHEATLESRRRVQA